MELKYQKNQKVQIKSQKDVLPAEDLIQAAKSRVHYLMINDKYMKVIFDNAFWMRKAISKKTPSDLCRHLALIFHLVCPLLV